MEERPDDLMPSWRRAWRSVLACARAASRLSPVCPPARATKPSPRWRPHRRRFGSTSSSRRASRGGRWPIASTPCAQIAIDSASRDASTHANRLPAGERSRGAAARSSARTGSGGNIEGFLFPATYEFTKLTTARRLVRDQLVHFRQQWRKVDLGYARSKNLTPYDVLIIASMIEKEAVAPEERRLIAAVIYNRLHLGMYLGIDATIRYGRNVPGTEPLKVSDLESDSPYNTRNSASGFRRPRSRTRGSRRSARPRTRRAWTTSSSSASPTASTTSSRRASPSSSRRSASTASAAEGSVTRRGYSGMSRDLRDDADRRHPRLAGRALALAAHAERRLRRARPRLGVRPAPDAARAARGSRAGLAALGFAGANVTAPHKLAVAALCETDAPLGQHARRPRWTHRGVVDRCGDPRRTSERASRRDRRRRSGGSLRRTHFRTLAASRDEPNGRPT